MNTDQLALNYDGPSRMTNEESLVFSLILRGRQNARSVDLLAELTGIQRRHVEKIVRRLIAEHNMFIGSSCGRPSGYYLITDAAEIDQVYESLRHRGIQILMRAAKLKKLSLSEVFGQERMEI